MGRITLVSRTTLILGTLFLMICFCKDSFGKTVHVGKGSSAEYDKIQDAIDDVPDDNNERVIIKIEAGTYKEKILIPSGKNYITLQGHGSIGKSRETKIEYNDNANSTGSTSKSATVTIQGDFFEAYYIHFKNSANKPEPGDVDGQAVAVLIEGDKAQFNSCLFESYQATLYDKKGRHYFKNCNITGDSDFILGDGQSIYKKCTLTLRGDGSFTAQHRDHTSDKTGFSFVDCDFIGSGKGSLGRAWGNASRVVISKSRIGDVVDEDKPWDDLGNPDDHIFYGMYDNNGPGADISNWNHKPRYVHQLNKDQADKFMSLDFIQKDGDDDWITIAKDDDNDDN